MRFLKITLFIVAFFNVALYAQFNIKKIILVDYEPKGSNKNQKIVISHFVEISNNQVHIITKLYKGISDTTFQLPAVVIDKLNSVFDGKKKLTSYLVRKTPPPGNYGGGPSFLQLINKNGVIENLVVVDANMSEEFQSVLDKIYRLHFGYNVSYQGESVKKPFLENIIIKYHNACKYLPNYSEPPSEKASSGPPSEKN